MGEPGATVSISVNGAVVGEGVIDGGIGGGSGLWGVDVPSDTLPEQEPFSATVTQTIDGDVQEAVIDDLIVDYMPIFLENPTPGAEVSGDVVFDGNVVPDQTVALLLEGTLASGEEVSLAAFSDAGDPQLGLDALAGNLLPREEGDPEPWDGAFDITERISGGTEWAFTPAEALELGEYTLSSAILNSEGEVEVGNAADFSVVSGGGGDETGGDENGGEDGTDDGTEDGGDNGGEDGTEDGTDDGTDDGADDGTEDGTDDGAEDGTDDGAEDGTDDGAEDGTDDGAEDGTEDGTDDGAEDGTDDGAEDGTDDGAEDGTDDGAEDGTDDGDEDELPDTGSSELGLALTGLVLLAAGGAGLALRTRRVTA